MKKVLIVVGIWCLACAVTAEENWNLDQIDEKITAYGPTTIGEGVSGKSIVLDGRTVVELTDSAGLNSGKSGFTASIWFNPYRFGGGQQMLMGKNRYSLNDRQWGIMIEPEGQLRAYLRPTVSAAKMPLPQRQKNVFSLTQLHAQI